MKLQFISCLWHVTNLDWKALYRVVTEVNSSVQLLLQWHVFYWFLFSRCQNFGVPERNFKKFSWWPLQWKCMFIFFLWVFFQKLYWEAAIPCWLFEVSKCLGLDRWNSWCLVYPGSVSSLATPPEEQCQVLSLHCLLPKPRSYLQAGGDRGTVVAFNCRHATS